MNSFGVPAAWLPFDAEDDEGLAHPCAYTVDTCGLTLTFPRALRGTVRLHGGWRMNPGYAVPWDCMRLPMLSFYGLPVRTDPQEQEA